MPWPRVFERHLNSLPTGHKQPKTRIQHRKGMPPPPAEAENVRFQGAGWDDEYVHFLLFSFASCVSLFLGFLFFIVPPSSIASFLPPFIATFYLLFSFPPLPSLSSLNCMKEGSEGPEPR